MAQERVRIISRIATSYLSDIRSDVRLLRDSILVLSMVEQCHRVERAF